MLLPQPACVNVLLDRYAACAEHDAAQVYARVALALAQAETPARRASAAAAFLQNMRDGAIGAGRIMANAGTQAHATMVNCFVQPVGGHDASLSFQAGLQQALKTLAMGGGVGYDFSSLPPLAAGSPGRADAPTVHEAIDQYDAACARLAFEGSRRGAQMAVLSCAHPDILDFAQAKHGRRRWRTFNISVAVSDAFLAAVQRDEPWPLVHHTPPGQAAIDAGAFQRTDGLWQYRQHSARRLWDAIAREAVHSAEPGLLFIDTIARANNLRALETIRATNPCGEQPLPDYGCCVLGPINLTRLVDHPFGLGGPASVNLAKLAGMVRIQVRMLDNVIALTHWPLPAQQAQALSTRRIGVGVTGLADMLAMLQLRYDSDAGRQAQEYDLTGWSVFALSNSGRTAEVIGLFDRLKSADHPNRYSLTAFPNSKLESVATKGYVLTCGEEGAVAATKSVIEQALFYRALLESAVGKATLSGRLADLAAAGEAALTLEVPASITDRIAKAGTIFWAGRNEGVAEELTLKTNEITRKPADYLEGTYAVHGIEEVMNADDVLLWVEPYAESEQKFADVLAKGVGMSIVAISSRPTPFPTIQIPDLGDLAPFVQMAAGWNVLVEVGLTLGIDLDKPTRARKVGNEFTS